MNTQSMKPLDAVTEWRIEKRKAERKALCYILTVNLVLIAALTTTVFFLPRIIEAYSVSRSAKDEFVSEKADRLLNSYKTASLLVFEQKEELERPRMEMDHYFDIFPSPSYPQDVSFWHDYEGWYSSGSWAAYEAWGHAYDLYYQGKIHGATAGRWCTFFAQMWFYDMYGFNSSGYSGGTGSGAQFASTVYNTALYYDEEGNLCHYFEYGDQPMTMGIVSVYNSYNPDGHVLCVDEVDYINGLITISEGNADGNGDVRIRQTMSLDTFYYLNPGYRVYVNPTPELINSLKES